MAMLLATRFTAEVRKKSLRCFWLKLRHFCMFWYIFCSLAVMLQLYHNTDRIKRQAKTPRLTQWPKPSDNRRV